MNIKDNIPAFAELGKVFRYISGNKDIVEWSDPKVMSLTEKLEHQIENAYRYNGWFTPGMVYHMISALGSALTEKNLAKWIDLYKDDSILKDRSETIAVVMAGNIPIVGFHYGDSGLGL